MDGDVNAEFLFDLKKSGCKSVIDWCMNAGLLASSYKCHKCGRRMKLSERKETSDGFEWRCRTYGVNGHEVKRSVRKGSWFSESKLNIIEILLVTYYWVNELSNEYIMKDLRLSSEMVVDWRNCCREVCLEICLNESSVLGGTNVVVELHQSKLEIRKLIKRKTESGNWIIGGLERDIIKTYILPGTTIVSDCWKSHDCFNDEEFNQFINSQSLFIKEPELSQNIASKSDVTWGLVKHQLTRNDSADYLDSYLAEIIWRRSHNNEETMECFLEALLKVYPPRKED